ncbi:MAG: electron transport complex subunit E [Clostridia bacterium]|nr:electron transport complex subunit E [Clostridia bacterium]MBQ8600400.1 electron transport complex subunit E [Clostridia bacterium]
MKIKDQFNAGLFTDNPVLIQLLGMCPTLATSTTLINAIGMGLSATFVLICSNVLISLLRKFIPQKIRIAAYIVIIAGFVTLADMLLEAYFNSIYNALGVFIPLIVVNCIILARAESFASKNKVIPSFFDGLFMGLGFTFALAILGAVREILGSGTILGFKLFGGIAPLSLFALPAGGFLGLGFLIALAQHLSTRKKGGSE